MHGPKEIPVHIRKYFVLMESQDITFQNLTQKLTMEIGQYFYLTGNKLHIKICEMPLTPYLEVCNCRSIYWKRRKSEN